MKTIEIKGFDVDGDPVLHIEDDGSLMLVFEFMPPLNGTDEGVEDPEFERFDEVLAEELGVEVIWDDRERFVILKPAADTVERLKYYLEHYWDKSSSKPLSPPKEARNEKQKTEQKSWWRRLFGLA